MNHITTRRVRAGRPACGYGCAGSAHCKDLNCQEHPINTDLLGLPLIDVPLLDEQIERKEPFIEMIEPVSSRAPAVALVVAVALAAASVFFVVTL